MKRTVDIVLATVLILITLPVMVAAALGSALVLRTNPLFTQTRIGQHGEPLQFLKFRTLPRCTDPYASKYDIASVRIPRFSAALRALKLDELPQLLLVLTGKMSLVGPRPEMPVLEERLDPGTRAVRRSARPGCTGLWQISDRCTGLICEAPEFDTYYVANRTLRLDLWILLRTTRFLVPFGRRPLTTLDDLPRWAMRPYDLPTDTVAAPGEIVYATDPPLHPAEP